MPLKFGEVRLRKRDAELDDMVSGSGRRLGPTARRGDALLELVRAVLGRDGDDHRGKGDREPDGERPHADEDSGREAEAGETERAGAGYLCTAGRATVRSGWLMEAAPAISPCRLLAFSDAIRNGSPRLLGVPV